MIASAQVTNRSKQRSWRTRLPLLGLMFLFGGVTTHAEDAVPRKELEESRAVAMQVLQDYRSQLIRELQLSGPVRALIVCRYGCQEITSAQARKTGWGVSMVSLKPRNAALAMPDVWEQQVLLGFEQRIAKGEQGEGLELFEIVTEPQGRFLRYARAIVVAPLCLACHGPLETLSESVKAQLAIHYPFDKATGYSPGQLYGIVAIKRPH